MKKLIHDHLSGHDITAELIGSTAIMCANGKEIKAEIKPSDLSMAKVCLAKRDIDGFGSFFE